MFALVKVWFSMLHKEGEERALMEMGAGVVGDGSIRMEGGEGEGV